MANIIGSGRDGQINQHLGLGYMCHIVLCRPKGIDTLAHALRPDGQADKGAIFMVVVSDTINS